MEQRKREGGRKRGREGRRERKRGTDRDRETVKSVPGDII
jgi:hypothetical protein